MVSDSFQTQNISAAAQGFSDFVIRTPDCVKQFLDQHFNSAKTYKPSKAMKLALFLLAKADIGQLDLILPDQSQLRFDGSQDGPKAFLRIHDDCVARKLLTAGKLGFCEAYLDGDWSSPDIATFFEYILRNGDVMKQTLLGKRWVRALSYLVHWLQPNSKSGSRKNIYSHYDIGNDFYKLWLDETMTYSSALFQGENISLKEAQEKKYQAIIDSLDIQAGHTVLEIGCGWGGFAEYAALKTGCKLTCITVSHAQYEFAKARIEKAGLSDQVEIRLQDYRDTQGTFDRIVSIEMFEAVGEAYWPTYFETLKDRLKESGKACLQIITIDEQDFETYRRGADYIQRYIFPGGMLPSIPILEKQYKADFKEENTLKFGKDYAKTLALWNEDFQHQWRNIKGPKMDDRFKRLWEQYLCYCQAGFETGKIDVIQLTLSKAVSKP